MNQTSKPAETIAIIPARGGSKGIPRKNITRLAGRPLIAYSILAATHSKLIDRVIVSTDDQEIAAVSKDWGAEVPFLRPKELALDFSSIGDAISYTKSKIAGEKKNIAWVELYPTSPFRTSALVDNLLGVLFCGYSSVITVRQVHFDRQFLYTQDKNGNLINIAFGINNKPSWKKYYRQYANFVAQSSQNPEKHFYYVLENKCMLIDIDTPCDLLKAEAIIENNLFDFDFLK